MTDYGPSILLATLYEKTSARGTRYFVGRLGAAKVALLQGRDKAEDGSPTWRLMVSEAPAKQQGERRVETRAKVTSESPIPTTHKLDDETPF